MRLHEYLNESMSDEEALQIFGITVDDINKKKLIKDRYRELARMYHPDVAKKKDLIAARHFYKDDKVDMMQKINLAHEKIKKMKPAKLSREVATNLYNDLMKAGMFKGSKVKGYA